MSTGSHLENLNGAQRKAVTFGESSSPKSYQAGPVAIVAGAGTGKTDMLAHRVAHLTLHGVAPGRMLVLTSTRRAATDLRRRAHDVVKRALNEPLGGLSQTIIQRLSWAGTFHSIGNRLLRHYGGHLKLDPGFTVADRMDSAELLEGVRMELGLASKELRFPRREICQQIYSYRVNTQKSLQETLAQQYPGCAPFEEGLTRLFRGYVAHKQRCNILDHDDLLLYWHAMMAEARLAQHLSANFDHVLVDDYQDASKLQVDILHALKPDGAGLLVAGDDAQAIYPFRAAASENVLGFPGRYTPRAQVITLAQSYRSTQQVLDGANALLAEAPKEQRRHLLSIRGQGMRPWLMAVSDRQAEAECVCAEVLRRREANIPLKRQAVLFRGSAQSDVLEAELVRRKIAYLRYGTLKFLEAGHVKDLLAVLRWADNPRNSVAAFRTLRLLPGIDPAQARKAIEHLEAHNFSLAALQSFTPPQACGVPWRRLIELMQALADPQRPWQGQVHLVREWYRAHFERIYEHFHTRIGDLDRLELLSGQHASRERYLTELTLEPPQGAGDEDYLTLVTVQASKGMEWHTVYVLNVAEGTFPSEFAVSRPELLEEERRLLYVAMTRAQSDLLLLTHGRPSRFLTEKVLKCFEPKTFHSSNLQAGPLQQAGPATVDVGARLKEMW